MLVFHLFFGQSDYIENLNFYTSLAVLFLSETHTQCTYLPDSTSCKVYVDSGKCSLYLIVIINV